MLLGGLNEPRHVLIALMLRVLKDIAGLANPRELIGTARTSLMHQDCLLHTAHSSYLGIRGD